MKSMKMLALKLSVNVRPEKEFELKSGVPLCFVEYKAAWFCPSPNTRVHF